MFHKKYQIIPSTNKVFYLPENLIFHKDKIKYLYDLAQDRELPNLLFYGNAGCGKHTLVNLLLYYLFGKDIFKTYIQSYDVNTNNNTITSINIKQSKYHMIFYPHNNNFDKSIIQNIVKTYISLNSFQDCFNNKLKIVVINNVDELNILAQQSLRRTMEDYSDKCRFIFISKTIGNIIEPLKSRCIAHRIENPTNKEMLKCALNILIKEKINFNINDIKQIINNSKNNINEMLLKLDIYSINGKNYDEYNNKIKEICELIKEKEIKNLQLIKKMIYNLIITNKTSINILFDMMFYFINNIKDINIISKIIDCGIKHNKLLNNSRRDIIMFNSFVLSLMDCLN